MLSLPIAFSSAIGVFAPVFSRPVWQHVKVLLTGFVCAGPLRCTLQEAWGQAGKHTNPPPFPVSQYRVSGHAGPLPLLDSCACM